MEALKEIEMTDEKYLFDLFRNRLLNLNIKDNSHIVICQGIDLKEDADYRPAKAIIRYINEMNREVTDFEIAVLLGRIDEIQKENEILIRANKIGCQLPYDLNKQINLFFSSMNWKTSGGVLYKYAQSQNPDFKFKTFIIISHTLLLLYFIQCFISDFI